MFGDICKKPTILLSTLLSFLCMSCAQQISNSKDFKGNTKEITVEVDDEITESEIQAGLTKTKYLLLGSPFLTADERNIKTLSAYKAKIAEYLEEDSATRAVQAYFFKLFNITEESNDYNYLEPSNLAAKLFKDEEDFREFLTASYCVGNAEDGFPTDSCYSATEGGAYELPAEMTAGFISTQAFLRKYSGAKNFRRISKVFEMALCAPPPATGEPEGWRESTTDTTLHPFYWSSINQVPGMDCTSCHGSGGMNQGRLAFTAFNENGFFQAGQQMMINGNPQRTTALTINDVERSIIGNPNGNPTEREAYNLYLENYASYGFDFETSFEPTETRFFGVNIGNFDIDPTSPTNPTYPRLSEMAQQMANSPLFATCMAQHMFQLAKLGKPVGTSYRPPEYASNQWVEAFKKSNYKLKVLLLEVFIHPSYLNL